MNIVNNVNIYGLDESVRGAKFPMSTDVQKLNAELTDGIKRLAQSKCGEGHDNWLNGVVVQFDLTFTVKAWTEMERYHFMDFVSSQSTMHRITKFDLEEAYIDFTDFRIVDIMKEKVANYNKFQQLIDSKKDCEGRDLSPEVLESWKKLQQENYLRILYSNPCGMRLTARMTTNYRQLKTIYKQRKNHGLPEWREFCTWIESLPHSELIIEV